MYLPLAKSILIPLRVTGGAATNMAIHKNFYKIIDTMKIMKSLEKFGLLIKGISKTVKNEAKEQKTRISWKVIRRFIC